MPQKELYIEDLLTDRNFIRWVKQPDEEQELYWKHWLAGHPDRRPDLLLAKELVLRSDFNPVAAPDEAFDEVLQRLMHSKQAVDREHRYRFSIPVFRWYPLRVAAVLISVALFSGLLIGLFNPQGTSTDKSLQGTVVKQNKSGFKSRIQLPDGTMVNLNAESKLTYPVHFGSLSREVSLEGEAFFEVAKDASRPFTVHSGGLSTTALGTSFNISAYPDENATTISLVSGKVMVSEKANGKGNQIILKPGEQALLTGDSPNLKIRNFSFEYTAGWKDGLLLFKEADIAEIVTKLQRWYGVDIQLIGRPDEPWMINGTFKNQSLERVLDRLSFTKDFTFEIDNKNVVLDFSKPKN